MSFKAIYENKIPIFSSLSRHLLLRFVCERAGKALVRLDRRAGSHEPLLLVYCEMLIFGRYFYLVLLAIKVIMRLRNSFEFSSTISNKWTDILSMLVSLSSKINFLTRVCFNKEENMS